MQRLLTTGLFLLLAAGAAGVAVAGADDAKTTRKEPVKMHRYMVIRTFPAGALDNPDQATKQQVNARN